MLFWLFDPDKPTCLFFQDCKDKNIFLIKKPREESFFEPEKSLRFLTPDFTKLLL